MIKVRHAKTTIENEEGMNHLWIQIAPIGQVDNVRIQISLPIGIHRTRNLNGFDEDSTGEISILNPRIANDIYIEIFTREPVTCGEKTINVAFCYKDEVGRVTRVEHFVTLMVVSEEEIDSISTDEEVVGKIKELRQQFGSSDVQEYIEHTPTKIIRIDPKHVSEWEKKYRIEGIIQ
ncbi:hypothetical protein NV379_24975 [Paenibacillus sp. N1-5-1-14]|uniref:hypothetical protein n=1 Tax=Paenibacillus TaxID=44249 RepID=UPI00096D38C4|nr:MULTISPECIES: hypothetical protein [Paenibacillus]MCR8645898.1 hypothetical protein [Paenibacillus radicibacter]OME91230.1 hypothetical protein BK127_42130 [Paenibacillus sp. FSL H7-0331]